MVVCAVELVVKQIQISVKRRHHANLSCRRVNTKGKAQLNTCWCTSMDLI